MDQRLIFIAAYLEDEETFSDLCERFEISRKQGYKWVDRYEQGGAAALVDRSRRPHSNPRMVAPSISELVLELRRKHPRWGPRKLLALLHRYHPDLELPAASTVGDLLRKQGLSKPRRRDRRTPGYGPKLGGYDAPNSIWCADFKGHFEVGKQRCHPLTITDGFSRFLLNCTALTTTLTRLAKRVFEAAFREYGLPAAIRTDNGPPFASVTTGGLSRLAVWWIKLGIRPERILPGRPDQNGRHERMHLTLKLETAKPPKTSFPAQQRAFDAFQEEFNHVRPHEALDQRVPASLYQASGRPYPTKLQEPEYPSHFHVERAYPNGVITFLQTQWYLSNCVAGEPIGIEPVSDGCWKVHYGPVALGLIDLKHAAQRRDRRFGRLLPLSPRKRRYGRRPHLKNRE